MSEYIVKSTIANRPGWTTAAIKKFLGEADKEVPNPHYKKAAPMKLYLINRIEAIEDTAQFKDFVLKSTSRKEGAQKGVKTKTTNLINYVSGLIINVPDFEKDKLIELSCDHFNNRRKV